MHGHLLRVERERSRRRLDPRLASQVQEIKRFQHARFSSTYRDLLDAPSSAKAARFFLDELYGPTDFSQRDAEFSRAAPKIAALFPGDIGQIVLTLARLHALTEELDSAMAVFVSVIPVSKASYKQAWLSTGQASARDEQIELVALLGLSLSKQVQNPLIRTTLRMMRRPATAAGLSILQSVLEQGFDAFRVLPDAKAFVLDITGRERAIAADLFQEGT